MQKWIVKAGLAAWVVTVCLEAHATGNYMPPTWLDEGGGASLVDTPEFFWELEVKRIARDFLPPEKRVWSVNVAKRGVDGSKITQGDLVPEAEFTARVDIEEFAEALKSGYVTTADPSAALAAHKSTRDIIGSEKAEPKDVPLPVEAASEFAEYHKAALAIKSRDLAVADAALKGLLKLPAASRKYRSTWAAFMLGKMAQGARAFDRAKTYFEQTRALAKEGFADALGLAADSYGWQALGELETGHPTEAARLYLTQLATGDASAVDSLKLFIPDLLDAENAESKAEKVKFRDSNSGAATLAAYGASSIEEALAKAAADPILCRLVTAHVLTSGVPGGTVATRETHWLEILEKAHLAKVPDAAQLAWLSYGMGKYDDAAHWLKLSSGNSPADLWLKAKFALREGKTKEATDFLSQAFHTMEGEAELVESKLNPSDDLLPQDAVGGSLGVLLLSKGDFVQALEVLMKTNFWQDAAYVAERVLTTPELLDFSQKHFPTSLAPAKQTTEPSADGEAATESLADKFHALVARRLVREDKYDLARPLFSPAMRAVLDEYTASLKQGANVSASKVQRARALFHAAWMARYQGMELMGTEAGPDGTLVEGNYPIPNVAMARLTGKTHFDQDTDDSADKPAPIKFVMPVSAAEKNRLAATQLNPERRFHYRHVAAGLAWKAAGLLPDGSEITADVLNTAGNWIQDNNQKAAERFYLAIKNRCAKTSVGEAAVKKRWFPEADGPWSKEEAAKDQAAQAKADAEAAAKEKEREEKEKKGP